MTQPAQTQLHRIYLADQQGDTLIVTPRGDAAGFSPSIVNTEMQVILSLIESGATQHLVVDLSNNNYFGSVVLGALVKLGNTVRARGGRIAMAGPSSDMQDILRLMKLDQMWELFPDVRSALRKIARIPFGQRLWNQRRLVGVLVLILAGIVAYEYLPRYRYGRQYYRAMSELWEEVEAKRDLAGVEEWSRLRKKCDSTLVPLVKELEVTAKRRRLYDAEPFCLYAARDHWDKAMDRDSQESDSSHRLLVQFYLRCAEARLEGRPLPVRYNQIRPAKPVPAEKPESREQPEPEPSPDEKPAVTTAPEVK